MRRLVKDAESFLLAIMESTGGKDHVEGALEFLHLQEKRVFETLDAQNIKGRERDRIIFYEGHLRGLVLQIKRVLIFAEDDLIGKTKSH